MILSKRIQKIESSGIRKVFDLATKNKGKFVNFSIGQPHFEASLKLKISAQKAISKNCNSYTPTKGILQLREEISKNLRKKRKIKADPENIIITSGTSGAIFLLFSSIFDARDEVILPDPYFVMYQQMLNFLGVKIKYLDTYPDFHINSEKLEKLISKKTKAIVLNSPNNPTGAVYTKNEIKNIIEIAKKNDILIISDEIYDIFDYDQKFFSPASIYAKTIILSGFSKSHSITGWRIGYAYGPNEIIEAMNKLQQYTFICAPSFAQFAMLGNIESTLKKEIANYKKKRNFVYENLRDLYELNMPEGAFYAFVKNPKDQKNFIEKLLKNNLLVVPGEVFSQKKGYFRISFAVPDEELKRGIEILKKFAK